MGILRKLGEKCKHVPLAAILALVSLIFLVGLYAVVVVMRKRRAQRLQTGEEAGEVVVDVDAETNMTTGGTAKECPTGSVSWSGMSKEGESEAEDSEKSAALLVGRGEAERVARSSPLQAMWQRRILMGERCKLPRFSGLILYDERGRPLQQHDAATYNAKPAALSNTTLKDIII